MRVIIFIILITLFTIFTDFKKFKRMSLDSKYDVMTDFHQLLNSFINTHKAINTETNDRKNQILSYVKPLYNKYFDAYKKNYDSEKVKDEEKRGRDYKRFEIIDKKKKIERKTEMQKPLWFKINKKEFDELTGNIYNNQDNNDFKIKINKKTYDLVNAKKTWTEVTTCKTTKSEQKNCITNLYKKTLVHWKNQKVLSLKNIIS